MTILMLIIGIALGFSGGFVLTALLFAAKQADLRAEEDFKSYIALKSI